MNIFWIRGRLRFEAAYLRSKLLPLCIIIAAVHKGVMLGAGIRYIQLGSHKFIGILPES